MGVTITRTPVVSVPVADQDRSLRFYVDTLGFALIDDVPMGPYRWVRVAPPGAETSLTLVTWFETMLPGSLKGLVLETDQLDEDVAALRAKGLDVGDIEEASWGRNVTFDDPDGNGIVLRQSDGR
jgi:catechol 2,3-dioxygenase-like lactoylglutathione lyase family enzyme